MITELKMILRILSLFGLGCFLLFFLGCVIGGIANAIESILRKEFPSLFEFVCLLLLVSLIIALLFWAWS